MVMLNSRLIASVGITTFILYSKSLNCVHLVFILRCDRFAVMRVKSKIRDKLFTPHSTAVPLIKHPDYPIHIIRHLAFKFHLLIRDRVCDTQRKGMEHLPVQCLHI